MTITRTNHLNQQALRKGISLAAIDAILREPGCCYPSFRKDDNGRRYAPVCDKHGVQQQKWTGEAFGQKLCIVVYPCCQKAITVWQDQVETEIRPDQKKNGITRYKGRDGRWRS